MNAHDVADALRALIEACEIPEDFSEVPVRAVRTYQELGVLTRDAGIVLGLQDGSEFQITIVQSRRGRDDEER